MGQWYQRRCGQRVPSLAVQMSTTTRRPSPPSLTLTLLSATMPSAATLLGDPCILRALHVLPAPPLPIVSTLFARPPEFEQEPFLLLLSFACFQRKVKDC